MNVETPNREDVAVAMRRLQPGPVIKGSTGADILSFPERLMWYAALPQDGRESIVVIPTHPNTLRPPLAIEPVDAAIALAPGFPGGFDEYGAYDPAAIQVGARTVLFYSGCGRAGDVIGRATSHDGVCFVKDPDPVLHGRAPEILGTRNAFHLFYVIEGPKGGYEVHRSTSSDGKSFSPSSACRVLGVGKPGSWDSFSVTTPRIFSHQDAFYMVYAGDDSDVDTPCGFGLARSRDLEHWERYARNPIFAVGRAGSWDDAAVWFGTTFTWGKNLYLLYEGASHSSVPGARTSSSVGIAGCSLRSFEDSVTSERSWVT